MAIRIETALLGAALMAAVHVAAGPAEAEPFTQRLSVARPACTLIWTCGRRNCGWRRSCAPACDRYSCSALYGAFGPYGGAAYWSAYTYGGWSYR
jgi:hypothetical protein